MTKNKKIIEQKDNYLYMAIFNYDLLYTLKINNILGNKQYFSKSPILSNNNNLEIFTKIGVTNQMMLISSLYSLFVLPKETIFTQENFITEFNIFLKTRAKIIGENSYHDDNLTRHLRNALAHSRVEFLSESLIEFKDLNFSQSITFHLSTKDISTFLCLIIEKASIYLNGKYRDSEIISSKK
jgi:hypothetical protein